MSRIFALWPAGIENLADSGNSRRSYGCVQFDLSITTSVRNRFTLCLLKNSLLINTVGATDPDRYKSLIGKTPAEIGLGLHSRLVAIPANAATLLSRHALVIIMAKNSPLMFDVDPAVHIGHRRSVRRYRQSSISRDAMKRLLTAASRAPSAHNKQPWRFVILDRFASRH